jgi:uncharacterized damage-inducible protein DinB
VSNADPRYPVGPFQPSTAPLNEGQREECIAAIENHPANMREAVAALSDGQLDTPYRDGGWTVRQVVHHVVDSHVNAYVRFKLAVTENRPTIQTYDEARWAELPDAKGAPVDGSLAILAALHPRWVSFLRSLDEDDFRRAVEHPEMGGMTVDTLLQLYGWHCRHHEAHVTSLRDRRGW